jgi:hypothetical protein
MSLTADLALVTACRDDLTDADEWEKSWVQVTLAALSLIEDTLNDHAPVAYPDLPGVPAYERAVVALHTIATALGVAIPET